MASSRDPPPPPSIHVLMPSSLVAGAARRLEKEGPPFSRHPPRTRVGIEFQAGGAQGAGFRTGLAVQKVIPGRQAAIESHCSRGVQLGGICAHVSQREPIPGWRARYATLELDTGGPKRGPERRGQKGPPGPEEALAPEGQGWAGKRFLSREHWSEKTGEAALCTGGVGSGVCRGRRCFLLQLPLWLYIYVCVSEEAGLDLGRGWRRWKIGPLVHTCASVVGISMEPSVVGRD
jgi:hypothetical protein